MIDIAIAAAIGAAVGAVTAHFAGNYAAIARVSRLEEALDQHTARDRGARGNASQSQTAEDMNAALLEGIGILKKHEFRIEAAKGELLELGTKYPRVLGKLMAGLRL